MTYEPHNCLGCHPGRAPQVREPGPMYPCRAHFIEAGILGSRIGSLRSPSGMTAEYDRTVVHEGSPAGARPHAFSSWIGLRRIPMPSISTSQLSPSCIHTGGLRAPPTPDGVPVTITSPGSSVMPCVM